MLKRVVTTTSALLRSFAHYSEVALRQPVVVTRNGRPRNILISVDEYEQLKNRDRQTFLAAETPKQFLKDVKALALGKA